MGIDKSIDLGLQKGLSGKYLSVQISYFSFFGHLDVGWKVITQSYYLDEIHEIHSCQKGIILLLHY